MIIIFNYKFNKYIIVIIINQLYEFILYLALQISNIYYNLVIDVI